MCLSIHIHNCVYRYIHLNICIYIHISIFPLSYTKGNELNNYSGNYSVLVFRDLLVTFCSILCGQSSVFIKTPVAGHWCCCQSFAKIESSHLLLSFLFIFLKACFTITVILIIYLLIYCLLSLAYRCHKPRILFIFLYLHYLAQCLTLSQS